MEQNHQPETDDIAAIARQLDRDRFLAAEAMTFEQRLLAGPSMFDVCVVMMRAGVLLEQPAASEKEIRQRLLERLRFGMQLEGI